MKLDRPGDIAAAPSAAHWPAAAASAVPITTIASDGGVTRSRYDLEGNVAGTRDAAGVALQYTLDDQHNRTGQLDGEGRSVSWQHDANGKLVSHVDMGGVTVWFGYDGRGAGRLPDVDDYIAGRGIRHRPARRYRYQQDIVPTGQPGTVTTAQAAIPAVRRMLPQRTGASVYAAPSPTIWSIMRALLTLCLLAAFAPAYAQPGFSIGHAGTDAAGKPLPAQPMTWRYETLEAAQHLFDRRATRYAPNAVLTFRLPQDDTHAATSLVELVQGGEHTLLPMASNTAFMLAGTSAADDARVVVNRKFPPGVMQHPHVTVRSYDLPPGVLRMGDLRLACQAQIAMAKTEGLKLQAFLGAASLFGLDVCRKVTVAAFDAPGTPFDTIVIEDGARRASLAAADMGGLTLGEKKWSDNARISFTWQGQAVR